jgi:hypothetical protein
MPDLVRAVCFPREDDAFATRVHRLVEGSADRMVDAPADGDAIHAVVEAILRQTYPMAIISPRIGMASADGAVVWYVFRDGTFLAAPRSDAG